jgi:hypothetical protein
MSSPVNIKVFYPKDISLTLKNKTCKEAIQLAWDFVAGPADEPIKFKFLSTNKVLYAHKETFMAYLDDTLSLEELILATQCDDVYRNSQEISFDGAIIDEGFLWLRHQNKMVMADDDHFLDIDWNEKEFTVIN